MSAIFAAGSVLSELLKLANSPGGQAAAEKLLIDHNVTVDKVKASQAALPKPPRIPDESEEEPAPSAPKKE